MIPIMPLNIAGHNLYEVVTQKDLAYYHAQDSQNQSLRDQSLNPSNQDACFGQVFDYLQVSTKVGYTLP